MRELALSPQLTVGMDQPDRAELENLARRGYRAVVDLRCTSESGQRLEPEAEARAAADARLDYRHVPIPTGELNEADLDRFMHQVDEAPKPAFVHCAGGKRSGSLGLVQLAVRLGWSGEDMLERARAEGVLYGPEALHRTLANYVEARRRHA